VARGVLFFASVTTVQPFPWAVLERVDRRSSRLLGALGARLGLRGAQVRALPGAVALTGAIDVGFTAVRVERARVLEGEALHARLADPSAGVARIRLGAIDGFVVVPGGVARRLAQAVLGGPEELLAPRPLTVAERAVLAAAVAAVLDAAEVDAEVEGADLGGPQIPAIMGDSAVVVEVATEGRVVGAAAIVLPMTVSIAPTRLATPAALPAWAYAEIGVSVVVARAALDADSLGGLRERDVLVVQPVGRRGDVDLRVARGRFRGAIATGSGRVTVLGTYERMTMDETLADDAMLDVAVAIGDLRMSMRALLELGPGQVLELGKPVGTSVELRLGSRVVARGELVDVDGEVGVRVLSLDRTL